MTEANQKKLKTIVNPCMLDKKTFKFRAECFEDCLNLLKKPDFPWSRLTFDRVSMATFDVERIYILDIDVEFSSWESIDNIRKLFATVPDFHIALETLNEASVYNGRRYWCQEDNAMFDEYHICSTCGAPETSIDCEKYE